MEEGTYKSQNVDNHLIFQEIFPTPLEVLESELLESHFKN